MSKLSIFGILATALYLSLIALHANYSWDQFAALEPNEWGDFLAGSLGPLAIFWLVLGFFQQGHELRISNRELANSVRALDVQAAELRASVEQQRELVIVTNKQLELDTEARDREAILILENRLPHFNLSLKNRDTQVVSSDGASVLVIVVLTNVSAAASSVRLECSKEGGNIDVSPNALNSVNHNAERQVSFRYFGEIDDEFEVEIFSENSRMEEKIQKFRVKKNIVSQISSRVL